MRITLLSGGHLSHNPRVIKEATTLTAAGYFTEVIGGWSDPALKQRDLELAAELGIRFRPALDLTRGGPSRLLCRLRTKLGRLLHTKLRWENRWQLGYFAQELSRSVRRTKSDIVIAHSEAALAALKASSRNGSRVGVDMEDWFSEDLLPEMRAQRPLKLLRKLEMGALRGLHSSCPSQAMGDALAREFHCRPPVAIYNAFEWADRRRMDGQFKDRRSLSLPSIHWYSQTIGRGRGLEDLFAALPYVNHECEIHFRGKTVHGFEEWLHQKVPPRWRSRLFVHGLVPNGDLLSRIAEHDIGFAGEMKYCRNKDLTVSNKILHYLLAGVAVVASDTAGQCEVAQQAKGAVHVYVSGDPRSLASHLNALLDSPEILRAAKANALSAAEQTFCWERQAPKLLASVAQALS